MCFETEAGTGAHPGRLFPADSDTQVLVPGVVLRERRQESWRGNRADLAAESRTRRPALTLQNPVVHNCVFMSRCEVCSDDLQFYQAHLSKESKHSLFFPAFANEIRNTAQDVSSTGREKRKKHL